MKVIRENYPNLHYRIKEEIVFLSGELEFNATYNNINIQDKYSIKIVFPDDYPNTFPSVIETGNRIPKNYHKLIGDRLCLGTPMEVSCFFNKAKSIKPLIDILVIGYLYRYSYLEKYKEEPFAERSHGVKGKLEFYSEVLGTSDVPVIIKYLKIIFRPKFGGHLLCPCGSGKQIRNCHQKNISELSNISKAIISDDLEQLLKLQRSFKL